MSLFRKIGKLGKAKEMLDKHGDKIADGVDKATDKINERTKGKYADKLDKVDEAARKLDKTQATDTAEPDTAEPDTAEPDTTEPDTTEPDTSTPTDTTPPSEDQPRQQP